MSKRSLVVGVVAAALFAMGITPAPASAAQSADADDWADTFCGTLDTYQTVAIRSRNTAVAAIKKVGAPDVKNGDTIQSTMIEKPDKSGDLDDAIRHSMFCSFLR